MADDLRGRVALVTGAGRRRGIGGAICRALAEKGADIFFTYWSAYDDELLPGDRDRPQALLQEFRSAGVRAEAIELDLSLLDSPEHLLDAATERLGMPSILVNNAVYSTRGGFEELDVATLDTHYAVNLRATALLSVGFARRFEGGTRGSSTSRAGSRSGRCRVSWPTSRPRELSRHSPERLRQRLDTKGSR